MRMGENEWCFRLASGRSQSCIFRAIASDPTKCERSCEMEILTFGLIATLNGYKADHSSFVPEPARFQPFDLWPEMAVVPKRWSDQ
jgi:hypothetical protein